MATSTCTNLGGLIKTFSDQNSLGKGHEEEKSTPNYIKGPKCTNLTSLNTLCNNEIITTNHNKAIVMSPNHLQVQGCTIKTEVAPQILDHGCGNFSSSLPVTVTGPPNDVPIAP